MGRERRPTYTYRRSQFFKNISGSLKCPLEGGGARKTVWTPSSNFVELNERITNLLSKYKSDVREKRYKGPKKGGVGGTTLRPLHFHVFLYLFCFVSDLHGSSIDIFLPAKELHCDLAHNR